MVPAALRHRDFSLFCGGVVLSGVGSQFTTVAMGLWRLSPLPLMTGGAAIGLVLRARLS